MGIDGLNLEESYIMEGAYLDTVISRKGIKPLNESSAGDKEDQEMLEGWSEDVVQILGDDEIELLTKYVNDKDLAVDMESFASGTGVLILHDHALSKGQNSLRRKAWESLYILKPCGQEQTRSGGAV